MARRDHWSWEDIFLALCREQGQGGPFEVSRLEVVHPLRYGALPAGAQAEGWDYRFETGDEWDLLVRDTGDRYIAFLTKLRPRRRVA